MGEVPPKGFGKFKAATSGIAELPDRPSGVGYVRNIAISFRADGAQNMMLGIKATRRAGKWGSRTCSRCFPLAARADHLSRRAIGRREKQC